METYEVTVTIEFTACHHLPFPDGNAEEAHWHTWEASATFRGDRLERTMGVLIDFIQVKDALKTIVDEYDSHNLNNHQDFSLQPPSAEIVARVIARRLAKMLNAESTLYKLSVTEAPGCVAAYYPQGFQP